MSSRGRRKEPEVSEPTGELSPSEIARVLSQFELGEIESVRTFLAGSSRAPKARVETDTGMFLLKRLAPNRAEEKSLRFQHQLIQHLTKSGFPVAEVMRSKENCSIVANGEDRYELVRWIEGHRYAYVPREAKAAGAAMAGMHDLASSLIDEAPSGRGFHNRRDVAKVLMDLISESSGQVRAGFELMGSLLRAARRRVRENWDLLPVTVVHGDWHPGNLLMGVDRVSGVIDFESVRAEPRVTDFANGILQFSLERHADSPPVDWPVACDLELVAGMNTGYQLLARDPMSSLEVETVPDLMIEAMAVESTIAIHRKGRIRRMEPELVIPWVAERLEWIDQARDSLMQAISPRASVED